MHQDLSAKDFSGIGAQRFGGQTRHHLTRGTEHTIVAGTNQSSILAVPVQDAAKVGTQGGYSDDFIIAQPDKVQG